MAQNKSPTDLYYEALERYGYKPQSASQPSQPIESPTGPAPSQPSLLPAVSGGVTLGVLKGLGSGGAASGVGAIAPTALTAPAASVPSLSLPALAPILPGGGAASGGAIGGAAASGGGAGASSGLGASGAASAGLPILPLAAVATAPLWAPTVSKALNKVSGQVVGGVFGDRSGNRPVNIEDALSSATFRSQVPQLAGMDEAAQRQFATRAAELGLLTFPGRADEQGQTISGKNQTQLFIKLPSKYQPNSLSMALGAASGKVQPGMDTLNRAIDASAQGARIPHIEKVRELYNLANMLATKPT